MTTGSKFYNGLALPRYGETAITGVTAATDVFTATGPDGTQTGNLIVAKVSSSAAVTAGALTQNGVVVDLDTDGVINGAFAFNGVSATGSAVAMLMVHGSKGPDNFLSIGGSTAGVGAATANGFLNVTTRYLAAPSTAHVFYGLKIAAGSKTAYVIAAPATLVEVA